MNTRTVYDIHDHREFPWSSTATWLVFADGVLVRTFTDFFEAKAWCLTQPVQS